MKIQDRLTMSELVALLIFIMISPTITLVSEVPNWWLISDTLTGLGIIWVSYYLWGEERKTV
jgi:hypothetical protein